MDPNIAARRKRNLDQLYARVKAHAPDLYTRAVALASMTFPGDLPAAARLEASILSLIAEALQQ